MIVKGSSIQSEDTVECSGLNETYISHPLLLRFRGHCKKKKNRAKDCERQRQRQLVKFKQAVFSRHSRAHELTFLTAYTRPVQSQAKPISSVEIGVGHKVLSLTEELLANESF